MEWNALGNGYSENAKVNWCLGFLKMLQVQ